ncbi:DUF6339 family protein [Microbacterium aquimaris]|uniref:DUF6339 family protein n=1 Tax=Microbacterium aquimaris TaxID=459816 RepID=UPI002AD394B4|nr:DUF6339 family protein [Microbacterium aquimaris]MDZ8275715.1 DUF6339 family protein [Microbacterium aquimaris]
MADLMPLDLLTADSVEELRSKLKTSEASTLWTASWAELVDKFGLKTFRSAHVLDASIHLRVAASGERNREMDAENSKLMLRALPELTAADATDERLWVTLALRDFRPYLHARWPQERAPIGNHLSNHAFAGTTRIRDRDHAISRLWWTGRYAVRMTPDDVEHTLDLLFHNSDLIVQFIQGRTNLSGAPNIARVVLYLAGRFLRDDADVEYNRENWRGFMQDVDFLAGRRALGYLSVEQLRELLEPLFVRRLSRA